MSKSNTQEVAAAAQPLPGPDCPVGLLDARVPLDSPREAAHLAWAAGLSFAIYGFVDPFDLVSFIQDRFLGLRGRIQDQLFVVEEQMFTAGGVMLSADHGSAAMFTILPGSDVDQKRLSQVLDVPRCIGDRSQECHVRMIHHGRTDDQDLIGIVANGEIGHVAVFEPLLRA